MALPLALGLGLLSFGGSVGTNLANYKQAQAQNRFQERMSSTAAQRAVADYRAAGLNPALAYDRAASSPSGVSATLGNSVAEGINSAQSARQFNLQRELATAEINLKRSQAAQARQQGALAVAQQYQTDAQTRTLDRNLEWQALAQPFQLRSATANAVLSEAQTGLSPYQLRKLIAETYMQEALVPGAQNQAKLDRAMGVWRPALGDIFTGVRNLHPLLRR